jgi:hypothetical protein
MDVDHLMESPREPEFLRPSRIPRP